MKLSKIINSKKTSSKIEQLYPISEANKKIREVNRYKVKAVLVSVLGALIIFSGMKIYSSLFEDGYMSFLDRNVPGKGDKNVSLLVTFDRINREEKLSLTVKEQEYTEEEIKTYAKEAEEKLWKEIKGDNQSLDRVCNDLKLINSLEGLPFVINWKSDNPLLISSKGVINTARLREELRKINEVEDGNEEESEKEKISRKEQRNDATDDGIEVRLMASLTYKDYSQDCYGYIRLVQEEGMTYDSLVENLREKIEQYDEESKALSKQELPKEVNGIKVHFSKADNGNGYIVLLIGIVCAIGLVIGKDKEIDREIKLRNEELEIDYPKLLNQYALYYCAGMSHRNIWSRITERYERSKAKDNKEHFVYEQMIAAERRMKDGWGEMASYEEFANRCANVKYRAFVNLIGQSVKKGRDDLNNILNEEIDKARTEANNRIRMSAQELSTKLLLPMGMMLVIVLVIVMVPAFISFN